ncbi:MAG: Hsp20/alpha crystallin family protein [Actinobacteria bacterium]|nr:Hsp20/alpha crystallin family protein [Actinomycetota bacterium]
MPLVRWTPFREMLDMPREMRRAFGRPFFSLMEPGVEALPPMDVYTKGSDMMIRMELPGIDIEDLDISLTEHTLRISGESRSDKEIKEDDYYRRERSYGRFERSLPVPEKVTEKDIDASYTDGILEVKVKGAVEEVPTKKIEVKAGKEGARRIRAKKG